MSPQAQILLWALFLILTCIEIPFGDTAVAFAQKIDTNNRPALPTPLKEWVIEGSGESPDLSQLPQWEVPMAPLPRDGDFSDQSLRSPLFLLLKETTDLEASTQLPGEYWNLPVNGLLAPPMSLP